MIAAFLPLYSYNILLTKLNSSWLIFELIKALEIKTPMLFNLVFASNTTVCALFSSFLIIELNFLTSAVIAQTFNPTVEREIPISRKNKNWKNKKIING